MLLIKKSLDKNVNQNGNEITNTKSLQATEVKQELIDLEEPISNQPDEPDDCCDAVYTEEDYNLITFQSKQLELQGNNKSNYWRKRKRWQKDDFDDVPIVINLKCLVEGCNEKSKNQIELDQHLKTCHNMNPFRCLICGESFKRK